MLFTAEFMLRATVSDIHYGGNS